MNNLVIRDSSNFPVLNREVSTILDSFKLREQQFEDERTEFRERLLSAMIDNNIFSQTIDSWVVSQVVPKDTVNFDTDRFIKENDPKMVSAFITDIDEKVDINIKKLKENFPDAYEACAKVSTDVKLDLKKLEKIMPEMYQEYVTIIKSDKPTTLRISENRKKKGDSFYESFK